MSRPPASPLIHDIARAIHLIRGQRVMLDANLARIYGVTTKRLNEQVKRNRERLPEDFAFRLSVQECRTLRSQIATSSSAHGGRRYRPEVFTEHGALMLASVLNTPIAIQASVRVVRAFVRLREIFGAHKELARKLAELEQRLDGHDNHLQTLFEAIRELMQPKAPPPKQIGFRVGERRSRYSA